MERKAVPDAVAVLGLDARSKTRTFAIDDEPTKLHGLELVSDDYELNVERWHRDRKRVSARNVR